MGRRHERSSLTRAISSCHCSRKSALDFDTTTMTASEQTHGDDRRASSSSSSPSYRGDAAPMWRSHGNGDRVYARILGVCPLSPARHLPLVHAGHEDARRPGRPGSGVPSSRPHRFRRPDNQRRLRP
jgi:hypothetical protein